MKNCMSEFRAVPRITSVYCEFPNRKLFPAEVHVPFGPNLLLAHTRAPTSLSLHAFTPLIVASAACVKRFSVIFCVTVENLLSLER